MFWHKASQRLYSPGSEVSYIRAALPRQVTLIGGSFGGGKTMASDLLTRTQLAAALTAYIATVATPFCGLFVNNITPTIDTAIGGLTEPTGSWYARLAITFNQIYDDIAGNMYVTADSLQFDYTGTDAPEVIYGYFTATLVTAGVLVASNLLAVPKSMGNTLDSLIVQPAIIQPVF